MKSLSLYLYCMLYLCLYSCDDSSSIGSSLCTGDIDECGLPHETAYLSLDTTELDSNAYQTITPTWSQPLDFLQSNSPLFAQVDLLFDGESLWLLWERDSGSENAYSDFIITELNSAGESIDEIPIQKPESVVKPSDGAMMFSHQGSNCEDGRIAVVLEWSTQCEEELDKHTCFLTELVLFGKGISRAPSRTVLKMDDLNNPQVTCAPDTEWFLIYPHSNYSVSRVNTRGEVVWRQNLIEDDVFTTPPTFYSLDHTTALSKDGIGITAIEPETDRLNLIRLNAEGEVNYRGATSGVWVEQAASFHDTQGRWLVPIVDTDGDLYLTRRVEKDNDDDPEFVDHSLEGYQVLREYYASHTIHAGSVDAAGTLFVATETGGREAQDRTQMLCCLPESGTASCYLIPDIPPVLDLQATDAGVVYAITGDRETMTGLSVTRFDF